MTLQSDIDVWAEGVRLMFSDACMGTFTNAQDYWLKVQKGMGESQDRTLCQQVILGLDKPSLMIWSTARHWPAPATWRS